MFYLPDSQNGRYLGFMTVSLCAQLLTRKKYKVLKQMLFYRHLQCNIYILSYI